MTVANYITIFRILLIPLFASLAFYYGESLAGGIAMEGYRRAAIFVFILASVSDGVDGFVARRFNQRSRLGAILDPIADKALLLTALVTLTLVSWGEGWRIPFWFLALALSRDVLIIGGISLLYLLNHRVPIRPHWAGKVCTFLQMAMVVWIMLKISICEAIYPVALAAFFTVISGFIYVHQGIKQLPSHLNESIEE